MQCWKNHGVSVHVRRTFIDLTCDAEAPDNQLSKSASGWISSCPDQSFTPWYGNESASETGPELSRARREPGIINQDAHVVAEPPSVTVRVVNTFIVVAPNGPGEDLQSLNVARRRAVRSCPNFEFEEPEPEVSPMQQAASSKPCGLRPTIASGLASEGAPILEDPDCFRQIQDWACSTPTSDAPMHSTLLSPTFGVQSRVDHQHKRVSSRELNLLHMLLEDPDCFQPEEWACSTPTSDAAVQSGPLSSSIGPQGQAEHQHKQVINHELCLLHLLMEDQDALDGGAQTLANEYNRHGGAEASFISSHNVGLPLLAVRAKSISDCNALDERGDFDAETCTDSVRRSRSEPQHGGEPPFFIPHGESAAVTLSVMRKARMRMHTGGGENGKGQVGLDEPTSHHGVQEAPLPGRGADGKACHDKATPFDGAQGEATTFIEALRRSRILKQQQLAEGVDGEPTPAQDHERHPSSDGAPLQKVSLSRGSKLGGNRGRRGSSTKSRLWCHFLLDPCMLENGFDLIKKIIGKNGCNTRDIYEATRAKIRVRGKGSGHIEGGREAPVPLMIAISGDDCCCKDFRTAFEKTRQLLAKVSRRFESHPRRRHVQRISSHPGGLRFWIGDLSQDAKTCLGSMTDGLLAEAGPADRTRKDVSL